MRYINIKLTASTQLIIKRWLFAASIAATTNVIAATDESTQTAYVDSVHNWGAWALDIEPAAGGIQAPGVQPLNARSPNVALRTNSVSALAPSAPITTVAAPQIPTPLTPPAPTPFAPPSGTPVTTVSPPPSPNIGPVSPGNTPPSGNGNLF